MPIAREFDPDLVLISAGFDAALGDPLVRFPFLCLAHHVLLRGWCSLICLTRKLGQGGCKVSPEGYAHLTAQLTALAGGRVIVALEGGYNLSSIAHSMAACTHVLVGEALPPLARPGALVQDKYGAPRPSVGPWGSWR